MLPPESKQWTTPQSKIDALDLVSVPLPTPNKGEVLVKIHAVSLNYRDVQVCTGKYEHSSSLLPPRLGILADKPAPETNLVPCSDMCGTVILSQDSKIKQGTRVLALFHQSFLDGAMDEHDAESTLGYPLHGVLAQYKVFPATSVVPVPKYLSAQEASCLPLAALAAWSSLESVKSAKTVLLQGTSPVSIAGLQLAKATGLQTVVTAPSEDHVKRAQELGADTVINHQTHWEWQDAVLEVTDKKGVDVVLETGSTRTLRKSFACVAFGGQIHAVGNSAGGTEDDGDDGGDEKGKAKTPQLHRLNVGGLALKRNATLRAVLGGSRKQMLDMLAFYEKNKIKPVVDKVFKFEEAKQALEYVAKGEGFGKVVISLEDDDGEKKE